MISKINFNLNGVQVSIETDPTNKLLDILRNILHRTGTKEGCGIGECGACTVIVNGEIMNSCILLVGQLEGAQIVTIEGLLEDTMAQIIKKCFVEECAVQCGFCTPGMILSAYVLLKSNQNPSRKEIQTALSGNLCRCTGYIPILNAVEKAKIELM